MVEYAEAARTVGSFAMALGYNVGHFLCGTARKFFHSGEKMSAPAHSRMFMYYYNLHGLSVALVLLAGLGSLA